MSLTFSDYQQRAMRTAEYPDIGNNLVYPLIGLSNETGELLGKMKKIMRDGGHKHPSKKDIGPVNTEAFAAELGDCLWYIAATAHELGIDLTSIAAMNLDKLADRARRGTIRGVGDNR